MTSHCYYVYIVASRSRTLYTGVTNNLLRRIAEHKEGLFLGFTKRYKIHRLVYYEVFSDIRAAIVREKQVKSWKREQRVALIEKKNRVWADLTETLY